MPQSSSQRLVLDPGSIRVKSAKPAAKRKPKAPDSVTVPGSLVPDPGSIRPRAQLTPDPASVRLPSSALVPDLVRFALSHAQASIGARFSAPRRRWGSTLRTSRANSTTDRLGRDSCS